MKIPVQINGVVYDAIEVSDNATREEVISIAESSPKTLEVLQRAVPMRAVVIPGKLINFVPVQSLNKERRYMIREWENDNGTVTKTIDPTPPGWESPITFSP